MSRLILSSVVVGVGLSLASPASAQDHTFAGNVALMTDYDDVSGVFPGSFSDEYLNWHAGVTFSTHRFGFDVRYFGTDIDASDALISQAFTTQARADDRVVLTVRRSV